MARALTRTNFHSSRLIRVLCDLSLVNAVDPGRGFAEKLGEWLNLNDAIMLCAAHNAAAAGPTPQQTGRKTALSLALGDDFAHKRADLVSSITKSVLPAAKPGEPNDDAAAYEPYRRYYLGHQRHMESRVRPLRAQVRAALANVSPALGQLVALDTVFDEILGDRESKFLSTIPSLLARRFEQLQKTSQQNLIEPQDWLARFGHELQTVLLAELDLRLQPTVGLIEAYNHEIEKINE